MTAVDTTLEVPALTGQMFVIVPVEIFAFGGDLPDPVLDVGYTVTMTYAQTDRLPATPVWYTASWLKTQPSPVLPAQYFARSVVGSETAAPAGPGALTVGQWWPYLHIVTPAEDLVIRAARPFIVR